LGNAYSFRPEAMGDYETRTRMFTDPPRVLSRNRLRASVGRSDDNTFHALVGSAKLEATRTAYILGLACPPERTSADRIDSRRETGQEQAPERQFVENHFDASSSPKSLLNRSSVHLSPELKVIGYIGDDQGWPLIFASRAIR
jgi:hypothetical protein